MIGHKDRALEGIQQTGVMDVAVGVVNEYAGLHIAFGVDVQIAPPTGDTAAHIFRIVLEIHGEDSFALAEFSNPVVHFFPLLWGRQQLGSRIVAHGHVVEEPHK